MRRLVPFGHADCIGQSAACHPPTFLPLVEHEQWGYNRDLFSRQSRRWGAGAIHEYSASIVRFGAPTDSAAL